MGARRALGLAVQVASVVAVLALAAGAALGQPVGLAFVETGSMDPTLSPGDGFVAVPPAVAGPVGPGDVVTFRAEELNGGGLVTHRVVRETERGLVTRGDANAFTDQSGPEPPVKRAQVVAVAWRPGGDVFVLPGVGRLRSGLAGVARAAAVVPGVRDPGVREAGYLVAAVAAALYVRDVVTARDRRVARSTDRRVARDEGLDPRLVVAAFALIVVVGATAAMLGPAGTERYGLVSAEFDADRPLVVPAGETATVSYRLTNAGVPAVAYVEPASDGVAVTPRRATLGVVDRATVRVGLSAPPETGYYRRYVVEHRYLLVLPPPVIDALHRVHPLAATAAVDLTVGVGFYAVGRLFVSPRPARRRLDRDGPRTD